MKTLKKTLCMVLAIVMVLGLFTVGSLAATELTTSFKDAGSINYKEAVDVLNGIGVIDGMDGYFKPQDTLTREQAAKILCYMILGKSQAEALRANSAPFNDVAANRWSAGFISFCVSEKIVAGVGDGNFDPAGQLTGYQWAKMLLVALGYDPEVEELTGANWAINTAKKALAAGIFDGNLDGNYTTPCTREEACLYALNTMKADMVEYKTKGTLINIGDASITTGGSAATKVENTKANDYRTVAADQDTVMQFAEQYWPKLKMASGKTTGFGAPGNEWNYKSEKIGTYAKDADGSVVITSVTGTKAQLKTWIEEINKDYKLDTAVTYALNGDAKTGYTPAIGDVLTVYDTDDNSTVDKVVVKRYEGLKIDDVDTNVNSADAKKGITAYVTIDGNPYKPGSDEGKEKVPGYNAGTYVKKAILVVARKGDNTILESYVATKNEGVVTAYTASTSIAIDGKTYSYNNTLRTTATRDKYKSGDWTGTYAAYTDKNGYAVYVDEIEAGKTSADALYVVKLYNTKDDNAYGENVTTYKAQVVDMTGKEQVLVIGYTKAGSATLKNTKMHKDDDATYTTYVNTFVTSKLNSTDNFYELVPFVSKGNTVVETKISKDVTLKTDTTRLDGAETFRLNSDTQYIIVKGDGSSLKITNKTGGANIAVVKADGDLIGVIAAKSGSAKIASYVVIKSKEGASTTYDDLLYYKSGKPAEVDGGQQVTLYDVNGKQAKYKISSSDTVTKGTFYKYKIDSKGVYDLEDVAEVSLGADKLWKDKKADAVYYKASFNEVYNNTVTFTTSEGYKYSDIPASKAVVVDLHETDQAQYEYNGGTKNTYGGTVSTLEKLGDLKNNSYTILANFYTKEADGAVIIFITGIEK